MENENGIPNIDMKVDLTKTVEKAYDDSLQAPLRSGSKVATTFLDFFHNTVLYPMQKYNIYAEGNLKKYAMTVQNRIESEIPPENLVEAKVNILGPTIESLKYNLDEEHIKEMFTNILISDMDNRKQDKVLPSYIEIVKQLSKDDADLLKFFHHNNVKNEPIMKLKIINLNSNGFRYISDNLILITNNNPENCYDLESIVIDNLLRLKLIEITFDEHKADTSIYADAFSRMSLSEPIDGNKIDYQKGLLQITTFGKNFIDICLS